MRERAVGSTFPSTLEMLPRPLRTCVSHVMGMLRGEMERLDFERRWMMSDGWWGKLTETIVPLIPIAPQQGDFDSVRCEGQAPGVGDAVEGV